MYLELKRADGVGDALNEVGLAVCKVVHRVSLPLCACAVMRVLDDAIHDGIAEVHVGVRHINLGAQRHGAFVELAFVHAAEKVKALFPRTIAEGAFDTRLGRSALLLGNHLGTLLIDVSQAATNHFLGQIPELLEIVGGIIQTVAPVESEPMDILHDGFNIFGILTAGIGIVETQVALSAIFLGGTEVHADGLGVSDVEIAVGFWWETCVNDMCG